MNINRNLIQKNSFPKSNNIKENCYKNGGSVLDDIQIMNLSEFNYRQFTDSTV